MKTNFKQIKNLITKLEKKEKELASYKAKIVRLEEEVKKIQDELTILLNNKTNNNQINNFSAYN